MAGEKIEITTLTILKSLGIILGLIFLWIIRDILIIVFFALIIASAVNPIVRRLQEHGVPRALGVILIYTVGTILISLTITAIFTPLAQELNQLSRVIPKISSLFQGAGRLPQISSQLQEYLLQLSERFSQISINVFTLTGDVLSVLTSAVAVLVISFYLAIEEQGIKDFLRDITPQAKKKFVVELWENTQRKLGTWLKAELALGLSVGTLTFIGLKLLGIQYALVLGILASLCELIPYVGPIIASVPAILLAFLKGPIVAIFTVVLYIIIQQTENYVLAPQVMKRAVALNPIIVIIVLLIGYKIGNFVGILLAVPITVLALEISKEVFNLKGVKLWQDSKEQKIN